MTSASYSCSIIFPTTVAASSESFSSTSFFYLPPPHRPHPFLPSHFPCLPHHYQLPHFLSIHHFQDNFFYFSWKYVTGGSSILLCRLILLIPWEGIVREIVLTPSWLEIRPSPKFKHNITCGMVRVGGLCVTHTFHKGLERLGSRALEDIIEFPIINICFGVFRSTNTRPKKEEFSKHHPLFTIANNLFFLLEAVKNTS